MMHIMTRAASVVRGMFLRLRDPYFGFVRPAREKNQDLSQPYLQHSWIYACVNLISRKLASVPLRLVQGTVEKQNEINDGELYRFFSRPNKEWSATTLKQAIATHLLFQGDAMAVMERQSWEVVPEQCYVFGRQGFDPVFVGDTREIDHWEWSLYDRSGRPRKIILRPWNVVHFSLYNPHDDFWGAGPLQVASHVAEQDWLATRMNLAFFKNGAVPSGFIEVERPMNADQRKQLRAEFDSVHAGDVSKWFQVAILSGKAKFTPMPLNYKEIAFIEQRKLSRMEIGAIFGVPPVMLNDVEHMHKATAKETYREFWETAVLPLMTVIEESWNGQFFSPYDNESTWCDWDLSTISALQEDRSSKMTRALQACSVGVPFNIANEVEDLGYPPIEGGDVGRISMGAVEVGSEPPPRPDEDEEPDEDEPEKPDDSGEDDEEEEGGKAQTLRVTWPTFPGVSPPTTTPLAQQPQPTTGRKPAKAPPPSFRGLVPNSVDHHRVYREWISRLSPLERSYMGRLRTFLVSVRSAYKLKMSSAMDRFERLDEIPRDFFDLEKSFEWNLAKISGKHFKDAALRAGAAAEQTINAAGIPFVFDPEDPRIVDFLKTKEMKIVENVVGKGLNDAARDVLLRAQTDKLSWSDLRAALVEDVVGDNRKRAMVIARTETAQCMNGVERQAEVIAGVEEHQWIATLDDRVRDTHLDMMALGAWPVGSVFPNGCMYPGDVNGPPGETIQCRCTIMAVK